MKGKGVILQATCIDAVFREIILSGMSKLAGDWKPGLAEVYKPELELACNLIFYYFTIARNKPTPGMKVFELMFRGKGRHFTALLLLVLHWTLQRMQKSVSGWAFAPVGSRRRRCYESLRGIEAGLKVLSLLQRLSFLSAQAHEPQYPSLLHRLAGYEVAVNPCVVGVSSSEVQVSNRKVLWETVESVMTAVALCINWKDVVESAQHVAIDAYHTLSPHIPALDGLYEYLNGISGKETDSLCAICSISKPENPCCGECGHMCCYYCLASGLLSTSRLRCKKCGKRITTCQPYSGSSIPSS